MWMPPESGPVKGPDREQWVPQEHPAGQEESSEPSPRTSQPSPRTRTPAPDQTSPSGPGCRPERRQGHKRSLALFGTLCPIVGILWLFVLSFTCQPELKVPLRRIVTIADLSIAPGTSSRIDRGPTGSARSCTLCKPGSPNTRHPES